MRVLMTADTAGGVWTYAMELTRALPDIEFVLAAMGGAPPSPVPPNVRLAARACKLEWMDEPWDDVARAGDWLLDLERAERPDLVHLNGYAHGTLPFAAPKIVVGHSCVLSWWRAVKGDDAPPTWMRYRHAVERGLCGADFVVAPSAWMLGALHEHYRFATPSRLIYNGRGADHRQLTTDNRRTIFAAGRLWDEAKNLRAVVDAAPRIAWAVRIAGDGGASAPNVTHLGRLDQDGMSRAFAEAGIYLFPALYEPFGLSILEAALAGCALVLGDIPSLREIWRDAAVFVPPRDAAAMACTVNEVIADDDFRAELARRARARGAEFTPANMAGAYRAAYEALSAVAA